MNHTTCPASAPLGVSTLFAGDTSKRILNIDYLRSLCKELGADDVGFLNTSHEVFRLDGDDIRAMHPRAKGAIVLALRLHRGSIRSPSHYVADREMHAATDEILNVIRKVSTRLEREGVWCVGDTGHFPMKMDRWPGKVWDISLKPLAVAAGLGHMGHNRLVLHPEFGGFMFLGAILIDHEISEQTSESQEHPCISCKLCVAACPTGAIAPDGHFDFGACLTHNYREKLGGFSDWVENVVESKTAKEYRSRVNDAETGSWWQSLSSGANTKCDACMAVCPAAADEVDVFRNDRKTYRNDIVKPLQKREEPVYVVKGSDAEAQLPKRFPHKTPRLVGNGLRPNSAQGFLRALPWIFQRKAAKGLNATYHFDFHGDEVCQGTVKIADGKIRVQPGLVGNADLHLRADSKAWLGFVAKKKNIVVQIMLGKVKVKGPLRLLLAFGKCFP